MEQLTLSSVSYQRSSRHASSKVPFETWQGSSAKWTIGVLKRDGTLDDLYGVTAITFRIASYGGAVPGSAAWVEREVVSTEFTVPSSAQAVMNKTEWNAEVLLTSEEMTLPVEDNGERHYWYEWRAKQSSGETILASGLIIVRGTSQGQSRYATTGDIGTEAAIRAANDTTEATARSTADAAEAEARIAADSALLTQTSALAATDATLSGQVAALETAVPTKALRDLTDATSGAVGTRLLAPESVTLDKLDPALRATIGSGFDPALFQSDWNAATNTPTIPVASGNNGKWYYVNVAGTATGNAAGTYVIGDRIISNGTLWAKIKVPPTVIPDGSLTMKAMAENRVEDDVKLDDDDDTTIVRGWSTEDGTELVHGFNKDGKPFSKQATIDRAAMAAMEAKTVNLGVGLLPQDWVANTEILPDGAWIMSGEERIHLPKCTTTEDGTELVSGTDKDGVVYPLQSGGGTDPDPSGYAPPDFIVFGQEAGGLGVSDTDGERSIITEDGEWKDVHPTDDEDVFIARSNRFGAWAGYEVNILIPSVFPLFTGVMYGFGVTGQSLAGGASSNPTLTTSVLHPGYNWMFNGGMFAGGGSGGLDPAEMTSLVGMKEVPDGANRESPWSGCFNRINTVLNQRHGRKIQIHCSNHSRGGIPFTGLDQGSSAYDIGLYEVGQAKALANAAGLDYIYLGTMMVHGENDRLIGTSAATYDGYLKNLNDTEAVDIMGITGQSWRPRLFTDGCYSWTAPAYGFSVPTVTLGQLSAALTSAFIYYTCAKYILTYAADGIHLIGTSSRLLGEYHAKAVLAVLFGSGYWHPFAPIEVGQTTDTVWLRMRTPQGHSMVFDTTLVSDPGRLGFELAGATFTADPYIDGDRVVIPKSGVATEVRYAYTGIVGTNAGPLTGPRGCLRDTDPSVSVYDSTALHNYAAAFAYPVP